MENNYSLSDIAAVSNCGEWGAGGGMWILIILFFLIGMGGGYGRGDYGQFATAASQQEILFGQQFQNLDNKADRLGNGIADATFALNNSIKDGNAAVAGTVVSEGRAIQDKLCGIANAIHEDGEKTRGMIQQNKIEALQAQINQLQLNQAMCGVVRYPLQTTYTSGGNPFCGCNCNSNF